MEHGLIDSGAMGYYIDYSLIKKLGIKTRRIPMPIMVYNVDHTENKAGKIEAEVELTFSTFGRTMKAVFLVTAMGQQGIILGLPWLEAENPDIDWKKRTLRWQEPEDKQKRNIYALFQSYKPTSNLLISFIKGEATEEAHKTWNDT